MVGELGPKQVEVKSVCVHAAAELVAAIVEAWWKELQCPSISKTGS